MATRGPGDPSPPKTRHMAGMEDMAGMAGMAGTAGIRGGHLELGTSTPHTPEALKGGRVQLDGPAALVPKALGEVA